MMPIDRALRSELVAMAKEDQRIRAELAADGALFQGYHPRMEEVHRRNGVRLLEIIEECGWPGRSVAGDEGAAAAWLVLQHAISMPALQRRGLDILKIELSGGEVDPAQVAMLEDRICFFEGRKQAYGTQYDWDDHGEFSPYPIEDEDHVDERRRAVGLPPLKENTRRIRDEMREMPVDPPRDCAERQRAQREWARSVGWRP
jgi:hypothetical protein